MDICTKCNGTDFIKIKTSSGFGKCRKCFTKYRKRKYNKTYIRPTSACSICGKVGRVEKRNFNGDCICQRCYKTPKDKCSICNEIKNICTRINNKSICRSCYSPPKRECDKCGKLRPTYAVVNKLKLCYSCYPHIKGVCSKCGKNKKIRSKKNMICFSCYQIDYKYPTRECSKCRQSKVIKKIENGEYLCNSCYNPPKSICSKCGNFFEIHCKNRGKPVCVMCYNRPKNECSVCKKYKIIKYKRKDIKMCQSCLHNYKYCNDEKYRIKCVLRSRVANAFKTYSVVGKVNPSKKYEIDYKKIIEYLGPCPGNRKDYHIDHIHPLSVFNFNDPIQIRAAFAPENHQWLRAEDNLKKCAKYDKDKFNNYITNYISKNKENINK